MCQSFDLPIDLFDWFLAEKILELPFASQYFVHVNLPLQKKHAKPNQYKKNLGQILPSKLKRLLV